MDYQILSLKKDENIGIITLSRPQALNALNSSFFVEMDSILADVEKDADIKVVIITGEGKAFAAGADIAEMSDMKQEAAFKFSQKGQDTFNLIGNLSKPVIAAVNGGYGPGTTAQGEVKDIPPPSPSDTFPVMVLFASVGTTPPQDAIPPPRPDIHVFSAIVLFVIIGEELLE